MASAKAIVERLEQIKARASEIAASEGATDGVSAANLAEEAAALGLELAELHAKKKKEA